MLEAADVDMFIIGDSLGMVLKGHETTVPVTMADMLYHAANVARVGRHALRGVAGEVEVIVFPSITIGASTTSTPKSASCVRRFPPMR